MKTMKLIALCLVVAVCASLLTVGTIAWLQDSDSDVNVMTMGNVYIKQHEYERALNADGTYKTATIDNMTSYVLQPFTQGKYLLPIVGDPNEPSNSPLYAGWDETTVRMTQVGSYGGMQVFAGKNAQDKFVTVENTGSMAAYVRTIVAIEVGETDGTLINTSHHGTWNAEYIGVAEIDGNNYMIFEYSYLGGQLSDGSWRHQGGLLPAGDTSYPSLSQVYLKSSASNDDCQAIDGNDNGMLDILVFSQAVQADGFENASAALDAAFGDITTETHPWSEGNVAIPVLVRSTAAMVEELEAGTKDLLVIGAEIDSNPFNGHYYKDRNIIFVDCTFTANMNWMYIDDATFTNCTFDCGSANAAVHYDELWGNAVFNNCTFVSGKIQIGTNKEADATVTFNNCEFGETTSTSIWSEKGMRFYSPTVFNGCEFNNRVVLAGANGLSLTFNSCTMNDGQPVYYVDNTDGIIRGGNIPVVTIR